MNATASQPLVVPRGLIFLSLLWLIGSWVLSIGWRLPIQASSASFEPGVRMMLTCMVIGLMIGWPLLRLSQHASPHPVRQTLLDLAVLLTLIQVVIWLPRLLTNWTAQRTAAVDATIAAWTVLAGAVVAGVIHTTRPELRIGGMLFCIALCLLGPLAAWVGLPLIFDSASISNLGPIMEIRRLTEGGTTPPTGAQWRWVLGLAATDLAAWIGIGVVHIARGASRPER